MKNKEFKLDFVGVGPPKCGTTWMASFLSHHPHICLYKNKEINYFNKTNTLIPDKNYVDLYQKGGIKNYIKLFDYLADKQGIVGEFSTQYFHDEKAPLRLKKHFPNTKIIIILRNPISRLYSSYYHFLASSVNKKCYPKLRKKINISFSDYVSEVKNDLNVGFYYKHIEKWYSLFSKKNVKIFIFNDIIDSPDEVLKELCDFLGIDYVKFVPSQKNKGAVPRRGPLYVLLRFLELSLLHLFFDKKGEPNIFGKMLRKHKHLLSRYSQVIFRLTSKESKRPLMDPKMKKHLKDLYYDDIKNLSNFLGRNLLEEWGFDDD